MKIQRNLFLIRSILQRGTRNFSSRTVQEPNENQPIKFSSSPAARKLIKPIMKETKLDMPWYQPYSVLASVTVFMIYFFILREENDVDMEFSKTLYSRIKGLEKEQLLQSYRYNKENNLSVVEIEKRLQEIEMEEAKAALA
ncbi:uncharacterized protein LOC105388529 [Plutella xylostella]|uniref:uncharacterized protein LOC105388529 n=1 Tax=Plutella xylostella TaxID=51655 RepID=UPI002032E178|nr:uncharacterized protein LOC105388529 [Plutella xylostella]